MSAQEFAPGIPVGRVIQKIPTIEKPKTWQFGVHHHFAEKAGPHFDLRLGDPDTGHAHSWAVRQLPGPGEQTTAVQQPTHTVSYMDFKGTIHEGYGAGKVELARRDKAEVIHANNDRVRFNLYQGKGVEEYLLLRSKVEPDQWLIKNVTASRQAGPGQLLPSSKPPYKSIDPKKLGVNDPNVELQAKIDGAHVLYQFKSPGTVARVHSYRPTERTTGVIDHTQKIDNFWERRTPSALKDTILRGELYAADDKGKALPAARIGGLLNANTWISREKQKTEGKLVPVVFDVVRWRGRNVESAPYQEKKEMLAKAVAAAPWLVQPRTATTTEEKQKLIHDIQHGKEPSTEEGVIEWHKNQAVPKKSKFLEERDVYVRNIFPESGAKRQGTMAGGFEFSYTKNGPIIGRVGTGMSHAMKTEMLTSPDKYEGLQARVKVQRAPEHYAPRAPSFMSFHLDQDLPESIKTAGSGLYNGKTTSPDTVKFKTEFQSIPIRVDRPKGFVMMGKDKEGKPWSRKYLYDYGFIPKTEGGDGDGLDVFIGPNKGAHDAYWAVQRKDDGTFDEYKVFLGFDSKAAATEAYKQHIPKKLLAGMTVMSVDMMKAMLGLDAGGYRLAGLKKTAQYIGLIQGLEGTKL